MSEATQQFDSFEQWVNKANSWLTRRGLERASCFDALDRPCRIGADFMRARDEGTFPVRWVWPSDLGRSALAPEIKEGRRHGEG